MPAPPLPPARSWPPRVHVAETVAALGAVALVLALTEVGFRATRLARAIDTSDPLVTKIADYRSHPAEVVIAGDSRVYHGVQPRVVAEAVRAATHEPITAYNFGVPSGYPSAFFVIARRVLETEPPPRLFVVGTSPVMFADTALVPPSHQLVAGALAPRDIPALVLAAPSLEEALVDFTLASSRLLALRTRVLPALLDGAAPRPHLGAGDRGWVSMGGRVPGAVQDARARSRVAGYAKPLLEGKLTHLNDAYLRALVAAARARGARVVFFGEPQARQLDVNHSSSSMVGPYLEHIRALARELEIDFTDLNDCAALENADFVDGDHLSEEGSARFSDHLARRVLVPALTRR
jgi:hypothetical protein